MFDLGFGHFNLDPKIRTGTDPKNTRLETEPKTYKYLLGSKFFYPKNRNRKKTDMNRPGSKKNRTRIDLTRYEPIHTRLKNMYIIQNYDFLCYILWFS